MKKSEKIKPLNFSTSWSYAPAPEGTEHVQLKEQYSLFINGKFTAPAQGKYFDTINPATEKKIVLLVCWLGDASRTPAFALATTTQLGKFSLSFSRAFGG